MQQIKACSIRKRKRKGLKSHTIMDCIAIDLSVPSLYNGLRFNNNSLPIPKETVSIELSFQDQVMNVAPAYYEHTTKNSIMNITSPILNKTLHSKSKIPST